MSERHESASIGERLAAENPELLEELAPSFLEEQLAELTESAADAAEKRAAFYADREKLEIRIYPAKIEKDAQGVPHIVLMRSATGKSLLLQGFTQRYGRVLVSVIEGEDIVNPETNEIVRSTGIKAMNQENQKRFAQIIAKGGSITSWCKVMPTTKGGTCLLTSGIHVNSYQPQAAAPQS